MDDLDAFEREAAFGEGAAPAGAGGGEGSAPAARREQVLLQLEPEEVERFGAVVGVRDRLAPGDAVGRGVEADIEVVVGALLPVGGAGAAGGVAVRVRRREVERGEGRAVRRDDGLGVALCDGRRGGEQEGEQEGGAAAGGGHESKGGARIGSGR